MNVVDYISSGIIILLDLLKNVYFIFLLIIFIVFCHILLYYFRDRDYIKTFNKSKDPDIIRIDNFKSIPVVNIIIPAWKEEEIFRECLNSIIKLTYPKLKIIVNAGGSEKTLEIARSFEKYENFIILHQKGGANRPSLGKIKAINECLSYISEGIIYFLDADSYINDEIILRMIFPIINNNENLVSGGVRPLKNQENLNLVKYLFFNRNANFRFKFTRYPKRTVFAGQNTCLKFEVIKAIRKFSEDKKYATDLSMAEDIYSKGFRSYRLNGYHHRVYVEFPSKFSELYRQTTIWTENRLLRYYTRRRTLKIIKILLMFLIAIYILIFPFFIFINFSFFTIGLIIFLNVYLIKIRKFIFFKLTINKQHPVKYNKLLFLNLVLYIYMEAIINFIIPFHFIVFLKKIKKGND